MSDTDSGAEAIDRAARTISIMPDAYFYNGMITECPPPDRHVALFTTADLKAMAKLWLMRGEIIKEMIGNREPYALAEIANKIEALEKE